MVTSGKLYQSPPGSGGNDGALPTTYDPQWPQYTNLTDAQKTAFKGFPQDLLTYTAQSQYLASLSGTSATIAAGAINLLTDPISVQATTNCYLNSRDAFTAVVHFTDAAGTIHAVGVPDMKTIYGAIVKFLDTIVSTALNLIGQINATPPTVTTRAQIDSAFVAVAPNYKPIPG